MSERYPIPAAECAQAIEIKRSRFLARLAHAPDAASAKAFVAAVQAEHPQANHNCWAFVAGPPGSTRMVGCSDDGEPSGTAGRPMLTVLLHAGVGEVVAVVTRYFGGTKLGTGGLVRAYSQAVQEALELLERKEKVHRLLYSVVIDYAAIEPFRRLAPQYEVNIQKEDYGADAVIRLDVPEDRAEDFAKALTEMTCGEALIEPVSEED